MESSNNHIHNHTNDAIAPATASVDRHSQPSQSSNNDDNNNNNNNINNITPRVSEIIEIMEEDEENRLSSSQRNPYDSHPKNVKKIGNGNKNQFVGISEGNGIENSTSLFSIDIHNNNRNSQRSCEEDVAYVAVGKSESSMGALLWTLEHCVLPRTTLVYLIHVFSEVKFIPSPFGGGMVPKTQVSPELVESYLAEDSRKRRELVTKYVDKCTSNSVHVETILIESESVANAIVELISVLNIRHLVVGISKSNVRKVKAGKGSGILSDQIQKQITSQECELKIICQGKEINMSENTSEVISSPTASLDGDPTTLIHNDQQLPTPNTPFSCCFKA